ncbi:MAG: hypothetical protein ACXVB1_16090 [Pseudobdellovibrionaceae bacterium]
MKKTHDLVIKTGEYTNAQGEKKNRYQNVGAVMEGDNGPFILLEKTFNPAGIQDGKNSVLISMFEVKPQNDDFGF